MRRAGWCLGSTLVLMAGVSFADDTPAKTAPKAAATPTQLTPTQVTHVLQRAAAFRKAGRVDHAVSLLQRSLLLTDRPEPRLELACAHDERARLYRSFADADKRRRALYTAHAEKEAAKAERLRVQARQLAYDLTDTNHDGRVSEAEGAALLRRLRGRLAPKVKLAGLDDVEIDLLSACATAADASGEALMVVARDRTGLALESPTGRVRAAAYLRAVKAQLRRRGLVKHRAAIDPSTGRLTLQPTRP